MPITLQEAKVGMTDKVDQKVIDMFQRSSLLLDRLTFDNCISPGTGGSTLSYGYIQLLTPATADIRKLNTEYTPNEAKRVERNSKAVICGGSFSLDRVIIGTSGAIDELAFQTKQKVEAAANKFHYLVINGQAETGGSGYENNTFDGLRKLLSGSSNEITSTVDITTSDMLDANNQAFLDELDELASAVAGGADMLMMNKKMLQRVRSCARRAGYYSRTRDDFGRTVETFDGIPMVDMGMYYNGSTTVDTIKTSDNASAPGKSDIYAVSFGLDGFHGISPMGNGLIKSYLPDLTAPGAVKTGDVELVAGIVLKNSLKAAVLRDVKIVAQRGG